jgi:hypothetical protein
MVEKEVLKSFVRDIITPLDAKVVKQTSKVLRQIASVRFNFTAVSFKLSSIVHSRCHLEQK